jgi:hypothetical protein
MRKHLIVKLRRPGPGQSFRIEVDPAAFEFTNETLGYDDATRNSLNAALASIHTAEPDAEFFQSFPKFVERLRVIDGGPSARDRELALFFRIAFPAGASTQALQSAADTLLDRNAVHYGAIETVSIRGGFRPAFENTQGYTRPSAEGGLGVEPAWLLPGGNGCYPSENGTARVKICVVDTGYQQDHPDLPQGRISYVPPVQDWPAAQHGTRVLGVIAAKTSLAPIGIANGARFFVACTKRTLHPEDETLDFFLCHPEEPAPNEWDPRSVIFALDDALGATGEAKLDKGDVLLVSIQTDTDGPVEVNEDIRYAFREASAQGITVVEAAGNKEEELPGEVIELTNPDEESHAIMVGAGKVSGSMPRSPNSRYGSRVDCQAWGECIYTTENYPASGLDADDPSLYMSNFGGTSGASAIIAGIVAVIQSVSKAAGEEFLGPLEIRDKLSNSDLGLAQPEPAAGGEFKHIGPQPDLMKILRNLKLLPDVFLRDDPHDTGIEFPPRDSLWWSPDIITRRGATPDTSQLANWSASDLSEDLTADSLNHVFVRVDNRGPFDDQPTVHLYWAYPSTFLSPRSWKPIGQLQMEVPGTLTGETKKISPPFFWHVPKGVTQPALIAVVDSTLDAVPELNLQSDDLQYIQFLRNYNNIAHRNILTAPSARAALWRFSFMVPATGANQETLIRITPGQPPAGTKLTIGLPPSIEHNVRRNMDLGGLRVVDQQELIQEAQAISGEGLNVLRAALGNPVGELSQPPSELPENWLYGDIQEVTFPNVLTTPGKEELLLIGAYVPAGQDPSGLRIDVVQKFACTCVGRINLRIA